MSDTAAQTAPAPKRVRPAVTILAALNKALHDAFAEDAKVLALGEDLADPEGGGVVGGGFGAGPRTAVACARGRDRGRNRWRQRKLRLRRREVGIVGVET